ncbi:MAG: thioredoxin family protein [Bacteroidales bacterium]|jgi:thiol:disulfide interchange protein|nr:thioredoxin family protein [Bacteroidales bacterium]
MRKTVLSILALLISILAISQPIDPVKWTFSTEQTGDNEFEIVYKATIDMPWHLYSAFLPENGPIATKPYYKDAEGYELVGELVEVIKPKVKFDEGFQMEVGTIDRRAEFRQKIKITGTSARIKGEIEYQVCDDSNCLPPAYAEFSVSIKNPVQQNTVAVETAKTEAVKLKEPAQKTEIAVQQAELSQAKEQIELDTTEDTTKEKSLWGFFWIAFGAGLLALLTPCVFPMIPMTVSFFMQGSENRTRSVFRGSVFGISIIAIYTLLGVIVSLTNLGPDAANALSTHWVPNLIFFLLFVIFAFSFFGMFELVLPSKWVNKADQGADKGGFAGAFFMALTTVLVSFSCTGPIVGALLVEAAGGLALKPILGMFGFGLAFAIPFTLFAIFPSLLKGLPKSGGWLNSVKVVLGFVVLAFSIKFLQPLDPTHKILSREVVLIVWTILFFLMGLYLLGKLKFSHDSDLPFIKVPRLLMAIASFAFAIFMFMGLFGAQLKVVAPLLPPKSPGWIDMTQVSSYQGAVSVAEKSEECTPAKHTDEFHTQYGLTSFYDLEEGLACARKTGKPVFLDFTGRFCSNCKKMEAAVWSDPGVQSMLRNDFILISLYTDVNKKLPEDEWYTSENDGKVKKSIGQQNVDYEISTFKTNTVPLYVIMDSEGNVVNEPRGTDLNVASYTDWMKEGLAAVK